MKLSKVLFNATFINYPVGFSLLITYTFLVYVLSLFR